MGAVEKNVLFSKASSTWFKGIAIVMIVLSHYAEWWSWFFTEEGTRELIRDGLSRSGPYGVAIFFLFSGYGLVKSAGNRRIGLRFVLKRISGVYIPYLIIVTVIQLLSGGFETADDVLDLFYGQDFWYMTVLFTLYIGFMLVFFVFKNAHLRALCVTAFTLVYSHNLFLAGEYDFWYISNPAFAIGVVLALYEPWLIKVFRYLKLPGVILAGIGTGAIVRSALYMEHVWATPNEEIQCRVVAVLIFTIFVIFAANIWNWCGPVTRLLGEYSMYLYLTHTFIFMRVVNSFAFDMKVRIFLAALITVGVASVIGLVMTKLMKVLYQKVENIVDFKHRK